VRCLNCQNEGIPDGVASCPRCGAGLAQQQFDLLTAGTLLNNSTYRIDYALGRGGFGITYRGEHVALEQPVAIKEFYLGEFAHREGQSGKVMVVTERQEDYTRGLAKFTREGQTLARIIHPNVVRVMNLFQENGTAYLVMEYLSGKNLKAYIKEHGRLPIERIEEIMKSLVSALASTHKSDIYHLDIKPANVMMEPDGRVVLIDFGAARQNFSSATTVPAFTPSYAPFEVMSASNVGPASDIFELGMLLHELLTGSLPPNALERMSNQNNPWRVGELPQPWKGLLDTALPLRYEDRPDDVQEWWNAGMAGRTPRKNDGTVTMAPISAAGLSSTGGGASITGGASVTGGNPATSLPFDGDSIRAKAVLTEAQSRDGGEAAYTTERGERGTFRCPPGVGDGEVVKLPGYGAPGKNGGRNGDLLITVSIGNPGAFLDGHTKTGTRPGMGDANTVIGGGSNGGGNYGGSSSSTGAGGVSGGSGGKKGFAMVGGLIALLAVGAAIAVPMMNRAGGNNAIPTPPPKTTPTPAATPTPVAKLKICTFSNKIARSRCPVTKEVAASQVKTREKCDAHAKVCPVDGKPQSLIDPNTKEERLFCPDHGAKLENVD
jgi:serine/threonine protein kinase